MLYNVTMAVMHLLGLSTATKAPHYSAIQSVKPLGEKGANLYVLDEHLKQEEGQRENKIGRASCRERV